MEKKRQRGKVKLSPAIIGEEPIPNRIDTIARLIDWRNNRQGMNLGTELIDDAIMLLKKDTSA